MKISFVRGAYLNNYEGQNYNLLLTGYSSLYPLDDSVPFPLVRLPSLADIQKVPLFKRAIKYIANRTIGDSQILFGLEKYIQNSDIVHVGDPHYYYSYQAARMRQSGAIKYLVSTWWETIPFNNESTAAKKRIKQFTMNQIDMFICHTKKAQECMRSEGIATDKIVLIPLGVDLAHFAPIKREKKECLTILFVGRLVHEKGILDLYEAFKQVAKKNEKVVLRIVGNGPLKPELYSRIQKDGLSDRATIEGVRYNEMPKIYQQSDILCVPSKTTKTWEEQYGLVFVEAMASGLPIVSYDTGSLAEIVDGAGILVVVNNIQKLSDSIIQIIETRKLREKLGTMGRERAEKYFDCRKTREKIYKLYESLNTKH